LRESQDRDGEDHTEMELRPPPGYYVERDPDTCTLRRPDGHFVAAFSARGVIAETIEGVAREDHRRWSTAEGVRSPRRGRDRTH
jgi:hypothetical protein